MKQSFTVEGQLPSLNEYIKAERSTRYAASTMKHQYQNMIVIGIRRAKMKPMQTPVLLTYRFYERAMKRDKDNIASIAHKFIQDALVVSGIIPDDGWKHIGYPQGIAYVDEFYIDKKNPRIEVELEEI